MKYLLILILVLDAEAKEFTFKWKTPQGELVKKQEAEDYEKAFRLAAKFCFQKLTNGKYPGEEKGLDIIDICANPRNK